MGQSVKERRTLIPKVSVIIPTYQHAHFVGQAVESVLAQTYKDYEIIVVDDGSTDNTCEVLAEFGDRITVIYQENRGLSAARNTGIRASKGQYVAFLDADDIWLPEKLEKQIPLFERDESVGLVSSDMFFFDENGLRMHKNGLRPETGFDWVPPKSGMVYSTLFVQNYILMPTVVVRRCCFDDVGFFDEELSSYEDHDMWLRIAKNWAVDYVNEPLAMYRLSATQMHTNSERMLYNMIRVQEKAFAESPELHELDLDTLDRCFYDLYWQLASVYVRNGQGSEARSALHQYARARGCTLRYYRLLLASWAPGRLLDFVIGIRR